MRTRFVLGGLAALMSATVPAVGLTPAEQSLFDRIPASVQPYCVPDTQPPSSLATASLICDTPTSTGVIAKYALFSSMQDTVAAYFAVSALMTGRSSTGYGGCDDGRPPAEQVYVDAGSRVPLGRWTCYERGGEAGLLWTRAGVPVLSWARRPDGRFPQLLTWRIGAGPLGAPIPAGSVVIQGPEALDRLLLRDISADVAAFNCVRVALPANAAWTNALRCDRPEGGDVTYRRYETSDLAQAGYTRTLKGLGMRLRMGGACTGPKPTERVYAYGGKTRGRFACTTDARGRTRLDWVDFDRRIHGVVRVTNATQAQVRDWWRAQPR